MRPYLLVIALALPLTAAQTAFADIDCTEEFGFCFVCTTTDDFTDEVSAHELRCTSVNERPGVVTVGCFPGLDILWFVALQKIEGDALPKDELARVRYRFDTSTPYEGAWISIEHLEGWAAVNIEESVYREVITGVSESDRLIYELNGTRSNISFENSQGNAAVEELLRRCPPPV